MEEVVKKKAKHKHKKHRKKRERSPSLSEEIDVVGLDMRQDEARPLKLKIKLGGQTFSTTKVVHLPKEDEELIGIEKGLSLEEHDDVMEDAVPMMEDLDEPLSDVAESQKEDVAVADPVKIAKNSEDDEEKWLSELEAGNLDDFGRLKKSKKVSAMTARQRSLYGHSVCGENELMELPLFTKKRDEDTEEVEQRRKHRAKKRKLQMQQQIEENKAQTISKLLSKQPTKSKKDDKSSRKRHPDEWKHVRYLDNAKGIYLCLTDGVHLPMQKKPASIQQPLKCAVEGCNNIKKYACSTTKLPVCSLQCYKRVGEAHAL